MLRYLGLLALLSISIQAHALSIGVNFHGGAGNNPANGASVTGTAGAPGLAQVNWNNVAIPPGGQTGMANSLLNNLGLATAASISWTANGTFSTGIPLTSENQRLMRGFLDSFGGTPGTVNVTGVPFLTYDVVVYFDGANASEHQVQSFTVGSQTLFGRDAANTNFNGTFIQIPNTSTGDLGVNTPAGNFMVFSGLSGNSFALTATAASTSGSFRRARVNGLQIVEVQVVPLHPITWLLGGMLLGITGWLRLRHQSRRAT